ncbi:GMC family oxidoreductase [Sorangium cellulosum]|uniref:GMC oxidoreductase n=1 Tax=Sorangium cellulosum TaxID=56 RepID=A0A150QKV3_SORCE|nr:GMC family oxidoreductase [Sorangium cellulosum]KYF68288.1 GMC oxidoreductase [Sorangium cellulosum]
MALGLDLDFRRWPALERRELRAGAAKQDERGAEGASVAAGGAGAEPGLSERERRIAAALAEAAMPPGRFLEGAGAATARRLAGWLGSIPPHLAQGLRAALWAMELAPVPTRLRPLSALPLEERMEVLRGFEQSRARALRSLLRAVLTPLRFLHYDQPEMFQHVGCRYELPTVRNEEPRWLAQVTNGREVEEDLELECEVLVIGTGAGGAAAAYELASRGHAVLMLEEGDYHRRASFTGRPARAYRDMYRDHGLDMAVGNVSIPVFAGRAVGGSTVINSGTCYRAPETTFASWRGGMGLPAEFSSDGLAPYYERVERMLQVAPADPLHLGAIGPIVRRGAERLGLRHGPLQRNAPDCDGQGICCFGCPTGAKRSTDVSYVPEALKRGAQLITAARVRTIDIVAGRARGATAVLGGDTRAETSGGRAGPGRRRPRLVVRAEAVVVAGGALMTPLLLRRSGACLASGMLGKNLSIHPASKVMALFDERIDQWQGIPQGYQIDHFADEGLMFEGGSLPFDVAALAVPWTGHRYTELMEQYPHLATFGFMIKDTSRGEVRPGIGGTPLVLYTMNQEDVARMQRGIELLCEVFLAAGARRVLPLVAGCDEVNGPGDLERLRAQPIKAGDLDIAAFHPLGTCRIGVDPRSSCLGLDHQAHDVAGLYVCDGSAIPSSLGVNPQMTIMAMSLRAAELLSERLSG